MAITIKDVAKQAGVSHSTVSRALHGSSLLSEETVERIRQIAVEMGYFPSAAARSLKTNRSHALGVIVSVDDREILQAKEPSTIPSSARSCKASKKLPRAEATACSWPHPNATPNAEGPSSRICANATLTD
jgi:transcriptional regulator with XRE-family HTH domain